MVAGLLYSLVVLTVWYVLGVSKPGISEVMQREEE